MTNQNEKPRRAHVLKVEFGANTLDDLCYALRQMAIDLRTGAVSTSGCNGSPSVGFMYEYSIDESWTKARYFAALDDHLAQADRNPEGHDPAEGHGAKHESPVGEADAPERCSEHSIHSSSRRG